VICNSLQPNSTHPGTNASARGADRATNLVLKVMIEDEGSATDR